MANSFRPMVKTKRGRHGGGTYVHPYIALDFLQWLEPRVKIEIYKRLFEANPNVVIELMEWTQSLPKNEKDLGGYIYLIQEGKSSKYKVGMTKNLDNRITTHKVSNCNNLNYVAYKYVDDALSIETKIKEEFNKYKISGEWFKFEDLQLKVLITKYFN